MPAVVGEAASFEPLRSLPGYYPSQKIHEIIRKSAWCNSVRDRGGRRFKSSRPDQFLKKTAKFSLTGHSVFLPDSSLGTE